MLPESSRCQSAFPIFSVILLTYICVLHYYHSCMYASVFLFFCCPWLVKPSPLLFMHFKHMDEKRTRQINWMTGFTLMNINLTGQSTMLSYSIILSVPSRKMILSPPKPPLLPALSADDLVTIKKIKPLKNNFLIFSTLKYLLLHKENNVCWFMVNFISNVFWCLLFPFYSSYLL